MEVRCASCNKLFRVSDDRIVGSGIKFSCTRCHETVKITKEEFEQYKLAGEAALLLASTASKPSKTAEVPPSPQSASAVPSSDFTTSADDSSVFDLSDPATAAAAHSEQQRAEPEGEIPGLFEEAVRPETEPAGAEPQKEAPVQEEPVAEKPEPVAEKPEPVAAAAVPPVQELSKPEVSAVPKVESKAAHRPEPVAAAAPQPKPSAKPSAATQTTESKPASLQSEETKKTPKPKPSAPVRPVGPDASAPLAALLDKEASAPAAMVIDAAAHEPASGFRNKAIILAVVLLVLAAAVFGVQSYLKKETGTGQATRTATSLTSPDGLQILNPSAGFDSAKGDLVITGTVQNSTDKPKPAWYVVVEVFDAQNALLAKARLLSGKQLYSRRDLDILEKRGADIQDLKMKSMEQGTTIPPNGSVNFEIRILDAPAGVSSFNAVLQPFDPVQLFKELAEEQK
jgi:phage FluMu protein Com